MSGVDPEDADWVAQCVRVDDFACDVVFLLSTRVRFCEAASGHIIPGVSVPLPATGLPSVGRGEVAASAVLGREEGLVRHYRGVVAAFEAYGRLAQLRRGSPYFWLRPAIVAGGAVLTECSWYDTVPEAEALLGCLAGAAAAPEGEMWDDLEQGWQMRVVRSGGLVCVAEWNWEERRWPVGGLAFDAARLSHEAGVALARLRVVHGRLVAALGPDWWG